MRQRTSFAVELAKLLEKVRCSSVAAIELQYFFKQALRFCRTTQSSQSLRAEKQ